MNDIRDPTAAFRTARLLRLATTTIEFGVLTLVVASAAALGSVHPWAYVPLWWTAAALMAMTLVWLALRHRARHVIGPGWFAFHPGGRRLIRSRSEVTYGLRGWSIDLDQPLGVPLLLPGAVFIACVLLQFLPLRDGAPLTASTTESTRGLMFVLALLGVHTAAAAAFQPRRARARFPWFLCAWGAVLAFFALAQHASGAKQVYWSFHSVENVRLFFGPFTNRNHFAGYMLLIVPTCAAVLASQVGQATAGLRGRPGRAVVSRLLGGLTPRIGLAILATLATVAGLVGSQSRGGLVAGALAFAIVILAERRRHASLATAALAILVLTWFGGDRLESRFGVAQRDAPGRTAAWLDAWKRMDGRWLTGYGFNTYGVAVTGARPIALPRGAQEWGPEITAAAREGRWLGIRTMPGMEGKLVWYRETHNDWVQILVETGVPGLLIAVWAAFRVLRGSRWLPATVSLAAVMLHALVDFDFQIPAVPVLFVTLAAFAHKPGESSV